MHILKYVINFKFMLMLKQIRYVPCTYIRMYERSFANTVTCDRVRENQTCVRIIAYVFDLLYKI